MNDILHFRYYNNVRYLDKRRLYHDYDENLKTIIINNKRYGFFIEKYEK